VKLIRIRIEDDSRQPTEARETVPTPGHPDLALALAEVEGSDCGRRLSAGV
jgi:hypothetical protein